MSYSLKIDIYNNVDYSQTFTLQNPDNTPLVLTGKKLIFAIGDQTKTLSTHTSGDSANKCIFIDNASTGEIRLVLPYAVTKLLKPANYIHSLVLLNVGDGLRSSVWNGNIVIRKAP